MNDVEYVKSVLSLDFSTEFPDEIPYPSIDVVIRAKGFDYLAGTVDSAVPNGRTSHEGNNYLWFHHGGKSILVHRFIVAVTLGKWPPRDFDVDHLNHNPSDNRPGNLRVVTHKDNTANRRKALLSELADLDAVSTELQKRIPNSGISPEKIAETEIVVNPERKPIDNGTFDAFRHSGPIPVVTFTGRTKRAEYSDGVWYETNLGSWHLRFD